MYYNPEANEINIDDLEAAAQMYDNLLDGTFYDKNYQALQEMRARRSHEFTNIIQKG